ncbi:beta-1,3-galactosyltransferase GALT1-like isoform X2 [Silene latifolia]|uniref:beta-1,3-galactosyltransferase GALT1-like isoform X2 n=1 Tax=Silene latifolia TaxID=37657 RepID=UPI003D77C74D
MNVMMQGMKKWCGGVSFASIFMLLVLRYSTTHNSVGQSSTNSSSSNITNAIERAKTNPLDWVRSTAPADLHIPQQIATPVIPVETLVSSLYVHRNLTNAEQNSLLTGNQLKHLISSSQALPNAVEAIKEASYAWNALMTVVKREIFYVNGSTEEKQCPYYLNRMNALELNDSEFRLLAPCGLTQGSSITIIGTPNGLLGNFRIDLTGEHIPGETEPPIILHYNVRPNGDQSTEEPVIVQNSWTAAHDWGEEERCPPREPDNNKKVDELDQCNEVVGKDVNQSSNSFTRGNGSQGSPGHNEYKTKRYFPFKQRYPFVATLRVGSEGIQMTVDGKHITSFAYRETLEPWLISEVRISGDLQLISVLASGLPTSEDPEHVPDLERLKSIPVRRGQQFDLFIGVFSTANNFNRRMAVRRTWMQYSQVRSGSVAVRFFVGLNKNQRVNEELWNEARAYGDIQLMPFVDYYSLITLKTVAICIFGTHIISAKYVMKTDDDAFVRVDEVLASLNRINVTGGLLYGLINSDSWPHRRPDDKWFISTEMFRLEDVAMGIWIADMKKGGLDVRYELEERIYTEGCEDNYVVAHYQTPRDLLCLWQKLVKTKLPLCCGNED